MNQAMLADTLAKVQEILKGAPNSQITSMMQLEGVRKDYPSGLVAYDLEPAARVLQPVLTPLRNRLPRVKGKGGTAANWKQITSLDTNKNTAFTAFGTKAGVLSYSSTDRAATYKTIAQGDNVSLEAIQQAMGLEDARANMGVRLLQNVMILEERGLYGGRNGALGTVTAPTVTTAATGGTIANNTYYVVVRAVTPLANAGSSAARGKKSTQTSIATSGTTSTISATTPYVDGATAYEWYVGTSNDNTTEKLEATTVINSVTLTAIAGTGATIPADNSADSLAFDGIFSQGSGTGTYGNFGYSKVLATGTPGVGTTFQLNDIDQMLLNLFNTYGADPEYLMMNPFQAMDLTAKCRAAGLIRFIVEDKGPIGQLVGGSRVTNYVNPVTGRIMDVLVSPWWPEGAIMALSISLPPWIPLGEIANALEVKTQLDYYQLEYAVTAPKYEIEVRCLEALAGYFLLGQGIIVNIARG